MNSSSEPTNRLNPRALYHRCTEDGSGIDTSEALLLYQAMQNGDQSDTRFVEIQSKEHLLELFPNAFTLSLFRYGSTEIPSLIQAERELFDRSLQVSLGGLSFGFLNGSEAALLEARAGTRAVGRMLALSKGRPELLLALGVLGIGSLVLGALALQEDGIQHASPERFVHYRDYDEWVELQPLLTHRAKLAELELMEKQRGLQTGTLTTAYLEEQGMSYGQVLGRSELEIITASTGNESWPIGEHNVLNEDDLNTLQVFFDQRKEANENARNLQKQKDLDDEHGVRAPWVVFSLQGTVKKKRDSAFQVDWQGQNGLSEILPILEQFLELLFQHKGEMIQKKLRSGNLQADVYMQYYEVTGPGSIHSEIGRDDGLASLRFTVSQPYSLVVVLKQGSMELVRDLDRAYADERTTVRNAKVQARFGAWAYQKPILRLPNQAVITQDLSPHPPRFLASQDIVTSRDDDPTKPHAHKEIVVVLREGPQKGLWAWMFGQ
jgi:hypothetical protein